METLKKINSKEYIEGFKKYLADNITDDQESVIGDGKKAAKHILSRFNREYNNDYTRKMYPSDQQRLASWLQGAPCEFPCYNFEVLEFAKELHEVDKLTEKQENTILDNFYNHLAIMVMKIAK